MSASSNVANCPWRKPAGSRDRTPDGGCHAGWACDLDTAESVSDAGALSAVRLASKNKLRTSRGDYGTRSEYRKTIDGYDVGALENAILVNAVR